jgi:uncharacterized protein
MDKKDIKEKICIALQQRERILFAFLYGSFLARENYRDIDIGVYFEKNTELLEIGSLITDLQQVSKSEVDIIPLNNLYLKNPNMAFRVVSTGEVIFSRDTRALVSFKENSMRYYFDTAYLRKIMNDAFEKRIEGGGFGKRNVVI